MAQHSEGEKAFYRFVGHLIRQARETAALNQEELAELVGLTRTSITNIEKGEQRPNLLLLAQICRALRCKPSDIIPPPETLDEILMSEGSREIIINGIKIKLSKATTDLF